jgi:hypothetical protein
LVVTLTGTFRPGGAERPAGEVIRGFGAPHAVLGFAVVAGAVVFVGAGDEAPMFGKDGLPFPHAPTEVTRVRLRSCQRRPKSVPFADEVAMFGIGSVEELVRAAVGIGLIFALAAGFADPATP